MSETDYNMRGPYFDFTQLPVEPDSRDLSKLRDGQLFADYEEGSQLWKRLTELWQYGVLRARWNEDEQCTEWQASEWGHYLRENDLLKTWKAQQEADVPDNQSPAGVEVLSR